MTELEMLTPRERQVYARRMAGEKNQAIAAALGISPDCVSVTFKNARVRIASGIPARGFNGRVALTVAQLARHRKRMRELARGEHCPRCELRGEHECLPALAELATSRHEVSAAQVIIVAKNGGVRVPMFSKP